MEEKNRFADTFIQEAQELLADIEDALLDMENSPENMECIHRIFRAIHTIKGSGAMFGFDEIAEFAHHVESLLEQARDGIIPVNRELINLIFLSRDQIRAMLNANIGQGEVDLSFCDKLITQFNVLTPDECTSDDDFQDPFLEGSAPGEQLRLFRIRFRPHPDIFASGTDPFHLLRELHEIGECRVAVHTENLPLLDALNPEQCFFAWDILLETFYQLNSVKDVFIFVEPESHIDIQTLSGPESFTMDDDLPRLGEILVDRGDIDARHIDDALKKQKRVGELLVESGDVSENSIASALLEQQALQQRYAASQTEHLRISSDKLDRLVNLVGEMVINQSRLNQTAENQGESPFSAPVKEMDRLTAELRDFALDMRMLPVGALFSRFRRLVRDLSVELGKEINLHIQGGETELDKTIIEHLHTPLVHLIRNSADHGLGAPAEREKQGKPAAGTITLTAAHHGARVEIIVADDGMGFNQEKIHAKAVEKGLISEEDTLQEDELFALVFAPGFSTAHEVTDVSGRGVGMDAVKREIESIGGTIQIRSNKKGTTILLSMPLTMAIIEGLQIRVAERLFILPVSQVETCAELSKLKTEESEGRKMIWLADELIPFLRLRNFFNISGSLPDSENIVVVQAGRFRVGVVVDKVLGNIQTVVKPLDRLYRHAEGISGATILADGTAALIVDLPELIRTARMYKKARHFKFS